MLEDVISTQKMLNANFYAQNKRDTWGYSSFKHCSEMTHSCKFSLPR